MRIEKSVKRKIKRLELGGTIRAANLENPRLELKEWTKESLNNVPPITPMSLK